MLHSQLCGEPALAEPARLDKGSGNSVLIKPEGGRVEQCDNELACARRLAGQAAGDHFSSRPQIGFPACTGGWAGYDYSGEHQPSISKSSRYYPFRVNSGYRPAARYEAEIPDQFRHPPRGRPKDDLVGRADLQELAAVEDGQAVGEGLRVGEFVGDEDDGHGPLHD